LKSANQPAPATQTTAAPAIDAIVDAWMSGDEARLAATLGADKFSTSEFADRLLTQRNKTWAAFLAARLQKPGTSFVSVGAAHMAGPDGVPALLAKMGFTVTRVPIAQTAASSVPSPEPAAQQTPQPSASPSPTPVPRTIEPPPGWIFVAASGEQSVTSNKPVKICGGKQNGMMTGVTVEKVREEIVIALSDRPYLAENTFG
jgi:hypothetical protein